MAAALPEKLMEQLPSRQVIEAVASAGSSDRVIASDVAARAGVSLSQARKDLTTLAGLTRGDIAVDRDGELLYSFPSNLSAVLAQNSAKYRAVQTFRKIWPAAFWLIRVSFGVTLLASLAAIFSTIFFLQASGGGGSSDDRDDRRGGSRGSFGGGSPSFGYSTYWGPSPFDFFYYRPYGGYGYYQTGRDPDEMGFLESVFSYIFGDGDPNAELEERRLALAASVIRANGGAVTAEQLAPFTDEAPLPADAESATYVDESYVLPIVSSLGGEPQVTDDGEIIYVFPELQQTAGGRPGTPLPVAAEKETFTLKRAGLGKDASTRDIARLLQYNGIPTRGALERKDLIRLVEKALPPMTESEQAELLESDPSLLQEREWKFSLAPDLNKFLAGGLGLVNLGGALYLGNMLGQAALYGVQLPSYFGLVQAGYPFLLAYAVLFNAIPLVRNFWIGRQNESIRRRNAVRRKWRAALAAVTGKGRIARKLAAAKQKRVGPKRIGASDKDIIFDTKKPIEEIKVKKEKQALEEFDKLLEKDEGFQ
jgi:hypothetical protein